MKTKAPLQETVEVIEQLEEEQIDLEVVRWFAGEGNSSGDRQRRLERLQRERGGRIYSDLLFALIGQRYPREEARRTWPARARPYPARRSCCARAGRIRRPRKYSPIRPGFCRVDEP